MRYQSPFGCRNIGALLRCRDVEIFVEWEFNCCEGTKEQRVDVQVWQAIELVAIILRPQLSIAVTVRSNSPAAKAGKTGLTLPCESYAPHKSPVHLLLQDSTHLFNTQDKDNNKDKSDANSIYSTSIQTRLR